MSSDDTPHAPSPRDRRDAVREKALQVQAQQSKAQAVRRASIIGALVVVIAAAAVIVTWVVTSSVSRPLLTPSNMQDDGIRVETVGSVSDPADTGGGTLADVSPTAVATPTPTPTPTPGSDDADAVAVDIRVYIDYLSPGSQQFQLANGTQLADWVSQGAATLSYHPVALLTPKSNGTKYSLRSAAAAACVATYAADTFYAFNQSLLQRQPALDTDGFSDAQLADIAQASGADDPQKVRSCIEGGDYTSWVQDATERALAGSLPGSEGVTLTSAPLVLVNGVPYVGALDDAKEFAQFVLTLSSSAYYTAAPTPTPTPAATTTPVPAPTPSK